MLNLHQKYLLSNVFRSPDEPAAVVAAPAADAAAAGGPAPPAAPVAEAKADGAAPAAAEPAAKTDSPLSPLASADAGKRDGAPKPDAAAKPADTPPPGDAKAEAKPDAGKPEAAADAKAGEAKPKDGDAAAAADGAKPDGEKPPAEAKPDAPIALPVYDAYKVPENIKLDEKELGEFNRMLGEHENDTKSDHAKMQALGQRLMDKFSQEVVRIHEQRDQHQREVWNRITETRFNELKADPEIGGNRIETTLGNVKYLLELGAGKENAAEAIAVLDAGGVSAHRAFIKALNGLYEKFREPQPVTPINPDASTLIKSTPGNRKWYDKVDGGKAPAS